MIGTVPIGEQKTIIIVNQPDKFDPWDYRIRLGRKDLETGRMAVAKPVEMVEYDPSKGESGPEYPMLHLGQPEMVQLMDAMWNVGIRPSDIGTPGHIATQQKHLEDMRALLSHHLGVTLPK